MASYGPLFISYGLMYVIKVGRCEQSQNSTSLIAGVTLCKIAGLLPL